MKALRIIRNAHSKEVLVCSRRFSSLLASDRMSSPIIVRFQDKQSGKYLSPKSAAVYEATLGKSFARSLSSSSLPQHFKIKLPALSPTMESGTLVQWLKKEGDSVTEGEPLCEIQTDKATMSFESPEAGVVAKILLPSNTKDIPVGKLIAVIVPDDKSVSAFANFTGDQDSAAAPAAAPATPAPAAPAAVTPATPSVSYPEHFKVKMPSLSPTMDAGTLMGWQKKEGDQLSEGDVLCEIQTDKATMAFETPEAGYLAKILVPANTANVQVGKLICIISPKQSDVAAFKSFAEADASAPAPKAAAPAAPSQPQQQAAQPVSAAAPTSAQSSRAFSEKPQPLAPVPVGPNNTRVLASPLARTIAAERGINLAQVKGTGLDGLITSPDVLKHLATAPVAAVKAPSATATADTAAASAAPVASGADFVDFPISNIRKVIAKRLVQSKQTIPHYYLTSDIEVDAVLKLRQELNAVLEKQAKTGGAGPVKLSVNDFVIKAASLACRKVPECNSAWMDANGVIRQYSKVDMSVAVATENGLITPIVFGSDSKGLSEISTSVISLAKKAREGRLQLNEFQGGTFTISNLGMFGIREFAAVINPPQACILAVGAAIPRLLPKAGASDTVDEASLRRATVMSVTLSCDHRVVDGAVGAQWLAEFKRLMEKPSLMLL